MTTTPTTTEFVYPRHAKELPRPQSPLLSWYAGALPPGCVISGGVVTSNNLPTTTPPTTPPSTGSAADPQYLLDGCLPGFTVDETLCPTGVFTRPPKPSTV
jgi:hypothetical protein